MQYQVTTPAYRRTSVAVLLCLAWAATLVLLLADPGRIWPARIGLLMFPVVLTALARQAGWRGAKLTATDSGLEFRGPVWTSSWRWPLVAAFEVQTRQVRWVMLPVQVQRRVLGVRLRDGQIRWLSEFNSRPRRDKPDWIDAAVARLNELARQYA